MIWLWLYLGGYVVSVLPIARWFLHVEHISDINVDSFVIAGCALMGLVAAAAWPLLIPGFFIYRALVKGLYREEVE